jgi:S-DNA-T family DNA segregation ATPase FtsK/SpoIIIE
MTATSSRTAHSHESFAEQLRRVVAVRGETIQTAFKIIGDGRRCLNDYGQLGVSVDDVAGLGEVNPLQATTQLTNHLHSHRPAVVAADTERRQAAKTRDALSERRKSLFVRGVDWLLEKSPFPELSKRRRLLICESNLAKLEQNYRQVAGKASAGLGQLRAATAMAMEYLRKRLNQQSRGEAERIALAAPMQLAWTARHWSQWGPATPATLAELRVGNLVETSSAPWWNTGEPQIVETVLKGLAPLEFPAALPLIGANRSAVLCFGAADERQATSLMHSLILRLAATFPTRSIFTLLDPSGHGGAFPMARLLPKVRQAGEDVHAELREVVNEIRRIHQDVLGFAPAFHELPEEVLADEPFEFVFVANFPKGCDRRALETIYSIGNTGPKAGRYLFLHYNQEVPLPRDLPLEQLENAYLFTTRGGPFIPLGFAFQADVAPDVGVQAALLDGVRAAQPVERPVEWQDVADLPREQWWKGDARKIISAPVGRAGGNRELAVWFGVNGDNRPCAHGMLGAMPGSGKSNLYHALILGLATRYSPDELQMYLIDGKFGVEFQAYRDLPHAAVVSLNSPEELSRSILAELIAEMKRRNGLFARTGANDLTSYRDQGQPLGNVPRLLLLIDEYQEMFRDDREGSAAAWLLQLSQQGRSAGIHMLLGSQRFGAPDMRNQTAIFGNIHMRMAMKMSQADVQALTEFGPEGRRRIRNCDLPGKIVVNDQTGDDNANVPGKVALLRREFRDARLAELRSAAERRNGRHMSNTVVFSGTEQPLLREHRLLARFLANPSRPRGATLQDWARRTPSDGGFGFESWDTNERPIAGWLGQEFNVHGYALLVLRRAFAEHAVVVGSDAAARQGMLAGWLTTLCAVGSPDDVRPFVVDRSLESSPGSDTLERAARQAAAWGYEAEFSRAADDVVGLLERFTVELEARLQDDRRAHASAAWVLLLNDVDRVPALRRNPDPLARTPQPNCERLRRLLAEGASVGLHLVVGVASLNAFRFALDERKDLHQINHRVALQMKDDDSHALFRSAAASVLQGGDSRPIVALYANVETGRSTRFKPFDVADYAGDLAAVDRALGGRVPASH